MEFVSSVDGDFVASLSIILGIMGIVVTYIVTRAYYQKGKAEQLRDQRLREIVRPAIRVLEEVMDNTVSYRRVEKQEFDLVMNKAKDWRHNYVADTISKLLPQIDIWNRALDKAEYLVQQILYGQIGQPLMRSLNNVVHSLDGTPHGNVRRWLYDIGLYMTKSFDDLPMLWIIAFRRSGAFDGQDWVEPAIVDARAKEAFELIQGQLSNLRLEWMAIDLRSACHSSEIDIVEPELGLREKRS